MSCPEKDFTIVAGDTFQLNTTIRDVAFNPIDITGYTGTIIMRNDKSVPVAEYEYIHVINSEDGTAGQLSVILTNADTSLLISATQETNTINYLLVLDDPSGQRESIMNGVFTILQPITR